MSLREVAQPEEYRLEEELKLSRKMIKAQEGDSDSYRILLAELSMMLEKYAIQALKDSSSEKGTLIAREITQEVLLTIHAKRHTYSSAQLFLPWVFSIAHHKLITWQKKRLFEERLLNRNFEINSPEDHLKKLFEKQFE